MLSMMYVSGVLERIEVARKVVACLFQSSLAKLTSVPDRRFKLKSVERQ